MDRFIQDFQANLTTDTHVNYAVDQIIAHVASNVQDAAGAKIFDSVERPSIARSSLYKSVTPYCNVLVGPPVVVDHSIEGVIITKRVPITLQCIFKVAARNEDGTDIDIQAWAEWLSERNDMALQPYNAIDAPLGLVRTTPWPWNFSNDMNLKNKASRTITEVGTNNGKPLSGSAYALNYSFNIDVWPFVPLT